MRLASIALPLLVALSVAVSARPADGQSLMPLRSDYLRDDRTLFFAGNYPEAFDVLSPLPEPPASSLPAYAYEVACWLEHHPAVAAGAVPFRPPITIRFYHVDAARPDGATPFFQAQVWGCGQLL